MHFTNVIRSSPQATRKDMAGEMAIRVAINFVNVHYSFCSGSVVMSSAGLG